MDMWELYRTVGRYWIRDADNEIVLDTVRKQEHWEPSKQGHEELKGSKYVWLYLPENLREYRRERFDT